MYQEQDIPIPLGPYDLFIVKGKGRLKGGLGLGSLQHLPSHCANFLSLLDANFLPSSADEQAQAHYR
ncbi:hypothetical protein E4U59_006246 [Claviceps monticola]|nr:hypothetical protein E4U59_006246 [Claviceps monticola]